VISPLLYGLEKYSALPQASSLCGACLDVCPVRIDLPRMLLELRNEEVDEKLIPWHERAAEQLVAFVLSHQRLTRLSTAALRILQRPFAQESQLSLPGRLNPAGERRLPALAKKSFHEMWKEGISEQ
jgi:L-lactate dehydrogenase complex protein LldF